jgi:hypothetical protein
VSGEVWNPVNKYPHRIQWQGGGGGGGSSNYQHIGGNGGGGHDSPSSGWLRIYRMW